MRLLLLILSLSLNLQSNSIQIFNIDPSDYPVIKGNLLILDADGNIVFNPTKDNLRIVENNQDLNILSLECQFIPKGKPVSTILSIDLSQSMLGLPFSLAKQGAKSLIDIMNDESETGISGFSDYSILFSDLTSDKTILNNTIDSLVLIGGTNFEDAFLNEQSGALSLAKRAKNNPIIIFLTDGIASGRFDEVIKQANEIGAVVHSVVLFRDVPNFLEEVSSNTGGMIFDNITTLKEIYSVYQTIYRFAEIDNACEVKWISKNCNIKRKVDYFYNTGSGSSNYSVNEEVLSEFEFISPQFISFQNTQTFDSERKIVEFKAKGDSLLIENITTNNPLFDIILPENISLPYFIPEDSLFTCFVQFNYNENGFHFGEFEIKSNVCNNNKFFASGGNPEGAADSYIDIIEPNGGEIYLRGADTLIRWQANYEKDKLLLEFSQDNGKNWQQIINNYSGYELKHKYPLISSDDCLIRITKLSDSSGYEYKISNTESINNSSVTWQGNGLNIITGGLDGYLRFIDGFTHNQTKKIYAHPSVTDVEYAPDALRYASSGSDGKIKIWLENSSSPRDSVLAYSSEVSCIEWSPDGARLLAGDNFGNLKIYNSNNLSLINEVKISQRRINDIRFSPDGRRVAIALSDTSIAVLFSINYGVLTKYPIHRGAITSIDWLNDDQIVSVSSQAFNNDVIISSVNLSSPIYSIRKNETLSKVRVNREKELFAFTGSSGKTHIYGSRDFALKYDVVSATSWRNEDLAWSPDFTRVVASSFGRNSGQTLKFTSIEAFPEFRTQSKSTFSIFQPIINAQNIDFGDILVNRTRANTIDSFVTAQSRIPIRIDSVRIIDDQFKVFSVENKKSQLLTNDGNYSIFVTFTPKQERTYNAKIEIFTEFNKLVRNITGTGYSNGINDLRVDFGKVKINKNVREQIFLKNTSSDDIMIDSILLIGINKDAYKIIDGNEASILKGNSQNQKSVIFEFTPNSTLLTNEIANIYFNEESAPARILLSGQGIKPELTYSSADTITTFCGELDLLNIKIENSGNDTLIVDNFTSNGLIFPINKLIVPPKSDSSIAANLNITEMGEHSITFTFNSNDIDKQIISKEVTLINYFKEYTVSKNILDFESKSQDEIITDFIVAQNTGNIEILWDFDLPMLIEQSNFELIEVSPNSIQSGESSTFIFRYTNRNNEDEVASLILPEFCEKENSLTFNASIIQGISDLEYPDSLHFDMLCDSILNIEIPINNLGSRVYHINNITANSEILNEINYPINLNSGIQEVIYLSLLINNYGIIDDVVTFYIDDFQVQIPIKISRPKVEFEIVENARNIGIKSGISSETYFTIRNLGDTQLDWTNYDYNNAGLQLISVQPIITPPNNSTTFSFIYDDFIANEFVVVLTDECGISHSIPINFYLEDIPQFDLSISNYDYSVGDEITLEIEFSNFKDFDFEEKSGLRFNLEYNPTLLENKSSFINKTENKYYEVRELLFSDLIDSKWLLPNYQVLWGNDSTSRLIINNVEFIQNDEDKVINISSGLLRVLDLCQIGGTRLYKSNNYPQIKSVSPNPTNYNSIITLFLPKQAEVELQLIDMLGNSHYSAVNKYSQGEHNLNIDLNISTGIYIIKINIINENQNIILTKKINVIK